MADMEPEDLEAAKERGVARMRGVRAENVHYDEGRNQLVISLTTGAEVRVTADKVQGLQKAAPADLAEVELQEFGLGIHFPRLDADIYVPALLEGVFGSKNWTAAQLGAAEDPAHSSPRAEASSDG